MPHKHISKRKPEYEDDEWSHITADIGKKIDASDVMDIQDRAITFRDDQAGKTKEEDYKQESINVKDGFGNTAQYLKFVNAHLAEKRARLEKLKDEKEKFEREIAFLKPDVDKTKADLDKINYNDIKPHDVRKLLSYLEAERETIKEKVEHFSSQIQLAQEKLAKKNEQIEEIQNELLEIEKREPSITTKITNEDEAVNVLQKQLSALATKNETEKIFGAINSLVVLLNSKNKATLNELNAVKVEFNKMKQEYDKVMKNLKQKTKR